MDIPISGFSIYFPFQRIWQLDNTSNSRSFPFPSTAISSHPPSSHSRQTRFPHSLVQALVSAKPRWTFESAPLPSTNKSKPPGPTRIRTMPIQSNPNPSLNPNYFLSPVCGQSLRIRKRKKEKNSSDSFVFWHGRNGIVIQIAIAIQWSRSCVWRVCVCVCVCVCVYCFGLGVSDAREEVDGLGWVGLLR